MLLNLSNHPSSRWSPAQSQAAEETYGQVQDLPFPNIAPEASQSELKVLAEEYLEKIQAFSPTAVHIMGEMTFTYLLVDRLKAAGIPCVASTTHRIVEEQDGKKIVQFQFIQFRPYF
jgi:hypothetical protein